MRLAPVLLVAMLGCSQNVPAIKDDAGDAADQITNPTGTFWETTDFMTDTKLQLKLDGTGSEFDTTGNATQTFAWDHLTPTSIEIFMCSTTCVLQGLNGIAFSTADKFTARILPANTVATTWTLVQSSTFP
jgi:hypothetical protein